MTSTILKPKKSKGVTRMTDFTPTWRTARESGQPDIGSGTLAGVIDDATGVIGILLEIAGDTDGGEGYWIFGIPKGLVDYMQVNPNGAAKAIDHADNDQAYIGVGILDRMKGEITIDMNDGVLWSAIAPFVFSAGSRIELTYQPRVVVTHHG